MTDRYVPATEQAKIIKRVLREAFPSIKFSVRKENGGSVRASWKDGPTEKQVNALIRDFAGGGFDGMQDLRYSVTRWWKGEAVRFAADFIFTDRDLTRAFVEKRLPRVAKRLGVPVEEFEIRGSDRFGCSVGHARFDPMVEANHALRMYSEAVPQKSPTRAHLGDHVEVPPYVQ